MGAGIAVIFKNKFKGVDELIEQSKPGLLSNIHQENVLFCRHYVCLIMIWASVSSIQTEKVTGQCAVLKRDRRFVYYLVTTTVENKCSPIKIAIWIRRTMYSVTL